MPMSADEVRQALHELGDLRYAAGNLDEALRRIVNATHDPSTSYVWALAMHIQIERSTLLTRDGDGHTSYLTSPCAQAAIDRYLISRARPPPGSVCVD